MSFLELEFKMLLGLTLLFSYSYMRVLKKAVLNKKGPHR